MQTVAPYRSHTEKIAHLSVSHGHESPRLYLLSITSTSVSLLHPVEGKARYATAQSEERHLSSETDEHPVDYAPSLILIAGEAAWCSPHAHSLVRGALVVDLTSRVPRLHHSHQNKTLPAT